jgi:hypothetical protein
MKFFALVEIYNRDSGEYQSLNTRIGGYLTLDKAIKAVHSKSENGRVLREDRKIAALIQSGTVTFDQRRI